MVVHGLKIQGLRVRYQISGHNLHRYCFQLMVYSSAPDGCVGPGVPANIYEKLVVLKCTILTPPKRITGIAYDMVTLCRRWVKA